MLMGCDDPEVILLTAGGRMVCSDNEFYLNSDLALKDIEEFYNYWEGTDTTQKEMPGIWYSLENKNGI